MTEERTKNGSEGYEESENLEKVPPAENFKNGNQREMSNEEWKEAFKQLEAEVKKLREELEKLRRENWELRFDGLTSLERRLIFFTTINREIEKHIKNQEIRAILTKNVLDAEDIKQLEGIPLVVTVIDLGYLSKYNEDPKITQHYGGGHRGGDEFLRKMAAIIQEANPATQAIARQLRPNISGYRLGGDEFGLIHYSTYEETKEAVKEFELKVSQIEILGSDLPPHADTGIARFLEAVEAFMKIHSEEERRTMDNETISKLLQRYLTDIADIRAKYNKAKQRIIMMVELLEKKPDIYERNFTYLQKGALRLNKEKFEELRQLKSQNPEKFQEELEVQITQSFKIDSQEKIETEVKTYRAILEIALAQH